MPQLLDAKWARALLTTHSFLNIFEADLNVIATKFKTDIEYTDGVFGSVAVDVLSPQPLAGTPDAVIKVVDELVLNRDFVVEIFNEIETTRFSVFLSRNPESEGKKVYAVRTQISSVEFKSYRKAGIKVFW